MFVRRAVSILSVVSLALIVPSGQDLVLAVNQVLTSVCHDGVWDPGEYCGYDAVAVTTVADMNHDCLVDGLDLALFFPDFIANATGPNLSGDFKSSGFPGPPPCGGNLLCPDGKVTSPDYTYFATRLGFTASPCTSVPIPVVCDGAIALSFSSNPSTIVNNATQAPGVQTMYVVVNSAPNVQWIEYGIATSSNVVITNHTTIGGGSVGGLGGGLWHGDWLYAPASGPTAIATIEYYLSDSNPATISIVHPKTTSGSGNWGKLRWTTLGAPVSHDFASVSHAGINGATPPSGGCPATITGNVYADVGNDCTFNGADYAAVGRVIEVTPGPLNVLTDAAGNYSANVPSGPQYTVKLAAGVNDPWRLSDCQAPPYLVNVAPYGVSAGNDFALKPVGYITGRVYFDFFGDCVFNASDFGIGSRMIEVNPGGYLGFTDGFGNYSITVPVGNYTVSQASISNDPWLLQCGPSAYPASITPNSTSSGNNFSLYAVDPQCKVAVNIESSGKNVVQGPCGPSFIYWPCPGLEHNYLFVVHNALGATEQIEAGNRFEAILDPGFSISTITSPHPISVIGSSGNQRTIQLDGDLNPGQKAVVTIHGTAGSGPYLTEMEFDDGYAGDPCAGTKTKSKSEKVRSCTAPCDPNDLSVDPEGCGPDGNIEMGAPLTYTIRFENIGLGVAHNVFIEDVLDTDLDLSSLSILTSSHTVTGVQIDPGNVMVISFDGIDLPGVNDPNNKGDVIFTIDPQPGLPEGTQIHNTAAITFDYNAPVITNTVTNTFRSVPEPNAAFTAQDACTGQSQISTVNFTYTGTTPDNATYLWNFGPGATPATSTAQNPSGVQFSSPGSKNVTLTVTRFGCVAAVTNSIVAPVCDFVCHNGVWSPGEHCGRDAYTTTGIPDMNHDCKVDALDLGLFQPSMGPNLSSDLNGDNIANNTDFNILLGEYGEVVTSGCTSNALPDTCEGTIALSFVEYPEFIGDNTTAPVGENRNLFVVVKDAPGAKIISYAVETSANVVITGHTAMNGTIAYACNEPRARIMKPINPLTSSPTFVGWITLHVTNTSPATITLKPITSGIACDDQIRWATASANRTHDFLYVTNAGINGPTPAPSANTCTPTAVDPRDETPRADQLAQNHPNPFNPSTTIEYGLASTKRVTLAIYDVKGALVSTLVDETKPTGWYRAEWNGRDQRGNPVASGVYLYRMSAGSYVETKKLVLLK